MIPIFLMLKNRISGGGSSVNAPSANCPEPGSGPGVFTLYADSVFASPLIPLGLPDDASNVPGAAAVFGAPDAVGWLWSHPTVSAGVGSSGIGFTPPQCDGIVVGGAAITVEWADSNAINLGLLCSDGVDVLYADSGPAAFGPGSLSLTLDAAQAAGLWDGVYSVALVSDGASEEARVEWDSVTITFSYTA